MRVGTFENWYELPLNEEAQQCVVGAEMFVDKRLTRTSIIPPRLAKVLKVVDGSDGRRVTFEEVKEAE